MRRRSLTLSVLTVLSLLVTALPAEGGPAVAEGEFSATIDFSTLTLTPLGARCVLAVDGELTFTGSLEGVASASTTALVFAPCEQVAVSPPGTFRDIFRSELRFAGDLNGMPVEAEISYQGRTSVGGAISAIMVLSDGLHGVLSVDGVVVVGGTYQGKLVSAP